MKKWEKDLFYKKERVKYVHDIKREENRFENKIKRENYIGLKVISYRKIEIGEEKEKGVKRAKGEKKVIYIFVKIWEGKFYKYKEVKIREWYKNKEDGEIDLGKERERETQRGKERENNGRRERERET